MSIGKDNQQWLKLWKTKDTDFHQSTVNRFLERFWPETPEHRNSRVFVPFCGKSRDMIWLAQQGYQVVGVELSPLAVQSFFRENGLAVRKTNVGDFVRFDSRRISILCGDYFHLAPELLGAVDAVYDCTALSALSEDVRPAYVAQMKRVLRPGTHILLLTIEDTHRDAREADPPEIEKEVVSLYGPESRIWLTHHERMTADDEQRSKDSTQKSAYKVYTIELN